MALLLFCSPSAFAGNCQIIGEECIEEGEERKIDGFKIHKDCWRKRLAYKCEDHAKNNCGEYNDVSYCYSHGDVTCKEQLGNWCVAHNKKFICEEDEKVTRKEKRYRVNSIKRDTANISKVKCGEEIRCIDGKCFNQTYETNKEMHEAIAGLATLKEIQKGFDKNNLTSFKGSHHKCASKAAYGMTNCCQPDKRLAEHIYLAHCKAEERELQLLKNENKCHEVGEYTVKFMGLSRTRWRSYCCYDSELAKEIQVQGRAQLGRGWGSPESPDCGGLNIEKEFAKLQFDKMNFEFMQKNIDPTTLWQKAGSMGQAMQDTANILEDEFNTVKSSWDSKGTAEERERDQLNNDDEDESYLRKPDGRDETLDAKKPWGGE